LTEINLVVKNYLQFYYLEKINITLNDPIMPKQIKVVFVGDSGVGKTSVLTQGCSEDPFISKIESTNMVDLYFKKVKVKENQITISVLITKNSFHNL